MELFPQPRSLASEEYERLAAIAGDLRRRVGELEHARDGAARAVRARSDELAALERRRAAGEDVSADAVRKAERALSAARAKASEPWPQRLDGTRAALRAADGVVQEFARRRYPELAAEIAADAREAARAVDDAMREVLHARGEHTAVGERAARLIVVAGARDKYGTVGRSTTDEVVAAIDRVMLQHGGEAVPAGPDSITPPHAEEVVA
jgi:hypothetical protein